MMVSPAYRQLTEEIYRDLETGVSVTLRIFFTDEADERRPRANTSVPRARCTTPSFCYLFIQITASLFLEETAASFLGYRERFRLCFIVAGVLWHSGPHFSREARATEPDEAKAQTQRSFSTTMPTAFDGKVASLIIEDISALPCGTEVMCFRRQCAEAPEAAVRPPNPPHLEGRTSMAGVSSAPI
jgi:hypothetical protein